MRRIYGIIRAFTRELAKDNISAYASSTAFFFFLSLMPTLIIICCLLPFTSLTESTLMGAMVEIMPDFLDSFIIMVVRQVYQQSAGILPLAVLVMLWSSGKGMLALMVGLNAVNEVNETRGYLLLRLEATFYMVITVVSLLVCLALSVPGKSFVYQVYRMFPHVGGLLRFLLQFRFLLIWGLMAVVFTITYTYVPNKKMKMRHQIPGAAFAAVGWSAFSFLFSIYVEYFHGMSAYGSLSTVIIMMFWLYCCLYILLIGANVNRYFKPLIRLLIRG